MMGGFLVAVDDVPRDITGPEIVSIADGSVPVWIWFLPLLLAIVPFVNWLRRRPTRQRDFVVRALEQLDRLQALQLLKSNQPEKHFTLLAGILRRYLGKALGAPAERMTTPEFLEFADRDVRLQPHRGFLTSFLNACDIARFAAPGAYAVGSDLDAELRAWLVARQGHSLGGTP